MNRLYYFLLLATVLGMASCSSDDSSEDSNLKALLGASNANEKSGYVSRLLAPPGFERGVGYCYATGAEY